MKPFPKLQQPAASSLPENLPSKLMSGTHCCGDGESRGDLEENSFALDFFSATLSQEYPFSLGDTTDPGFGDLLDLNFGEFSDMEVVDWDDDGMFSRVEIIDDEGFESQPVEMTKCYQGSHEDICVEALRWSGKQLWEMTDEEFRGFCSRPPPWE